MKSAKIFFACSGDKTYIENIGYDVLALDYYYQNSSYLFRKDILSSYKKIVLVFSLVRTAFSCQAMKMLSKFSV